MKPILFNTDMVRAILDGRKTVTRRVVRNAPNRGDLKPYKAQGVIGMIASNGRVFMPKPPYRTGDVLYVKETWREDQFNYGEYCYRAEDLMPDQWPWRSSLHMPKEAARIFLRVTNVRVEMLQDISELEAEVEGAARAFPYEDENGKICYMNSADGTYKSGFADLWNKTLKPKDVASYCWAANPWVWVIEFERISKEVLLEHEE